MEVASLKHEGNVVKLIETFKENEYDIFHERNISSEKGMGNISKIFIRSNIGDQVWLITSRHTVPDLFAVFSQ